MSKRAICAGIVVADHVCSPIDHLPRAGELVKADRMMLTIGGCAANVATDLARMAIDATVVGRVGEDTFGRVVTDLLKEEGVDVSGLQADSQAETSQTLIVNVQGEDRRFIHSFGANARFTAADLPEDLSAGALYVGGYLVMPSLNQEELALVFAKAQKAGALTILDVVVPGPGDHLAEMAKLLPFVDYFLPNDLEAGELTGEKEPVAQAKIFRDHGVKTCIVTRGKEGVVVVGEKERFRAGAFSVETVDGSGGGDAFTAGLITGLLREAPLNECVAIASALGASCVTAIGTTTGVFTEKQCEEFLKENQLNIEPF